jgi:hypothetical protein
MEARSRAAEAHLGLWRSMLKMWRLTMELWRVIFKVWSPTLESLRLILRSWSIAWSQRLILKTLTLEPFRLTLKS